ncbi:ABC transporter substrate-binding protein [Microvirga massiliensis]|uniref:ABC transporter substrate-binding protein n=1 Tax=Microvirga massiliensis TaxID=1033741 RepID=UPI00062B9D3E|nr:sugar ABC transporter substrate-binding protein [Microvirga massiliensis]
MDRRTFIAGLAGAIVPARFALAAPATDTKATLNVFRPASDSDIRLSKSAIERFNARFPNVTVNVQYVNTNPWGEYINQLMNLVGSNQAPDIVMMATEGVSTLASRNLMRDIMPFVNGDPQGKALFEDIEPNLLNGLRYKDQLGYVPNEWNTVVTFYNAAMFAEAGISKPKADWTWSDFLDAAKALTRRDGDNVTRYGYFIPGGQFALSTWFLSNGTDRLTPDGRASNAKDPKFAEALQLLHSLIFEHKVAPIFARNDPGHGQFIAKQVAMFAGTHTRVPEMAQAKMDTVEVQYCPQNKAQAAICGVGGLGITQASKNPELAWELLKELAGKANADQLAKDLRAIPAVRSSATSEAYVGYPANAAIFYGSAARAKPLAQPPNFAQVEEITMRHIESYLTGNEKLEPMINALDSELNRAMARVKW